MSYSATFTLTVNGTNIYTFDTLKWIDFFSVELNQYSDPVYDSKNFISAAVTTEFSASITIDTSFNNAIYIESWSVECLEFVSQIIILPRDITVIENFELLKTAVLTPIINTSVEQTAISLTIPGYTLKEGDFIDFQWLIEFLNNTGATQNVVRNFYINGVQQFTVFNAQATESLMCRNFYGLVLMRLNNNLWFASNMPTRFTSGYYQHAPIAFYEWNGTGDSFTPALGNIVVAPDFSQNIVLEVKIKLQVASSNFYYKPICSWIFRKASSN